MHGHRRKLLVAALIAVLVFTSVLLFKVPSTYGADWWDANWLYRKSHIISSAVGSGTNYQVKITVYYGNGVDSGGNVYCNNHSQTDFDDIRFVDIDNVTGLDYWLEAKTDSVSAIFWVEVQDDLSVASVTIWMYYGNPLAASVSNGDNTFLFFDHFTDAALNTTVKWTVAEGVGYAVASSYLNISAHTSIKSKTTSNKGRLRTSFQMVTDGDWWVGWQQNLHAGNWVIIDCINAPANKWMGSLNNGTRTDTASYANDVNLHTYEIDWTTKSEAWYQDDTSKGNLTTDSANAMPIYIELFNSARILVDWLFRGVFVSPEPAHSSWSAEEIGASTPISGNCTSTVTFIVGKDDWVNVTVSDADGLTDISTIDAFMNISGQDFTLRWTCSSGVFSEVSDAANICTLNTSASTNATQNVTASIVSFYFKFTSTATLGSWSVYVNVTDTTSRIGSGAYPSEFVLSAYYLNTSVMYGSGTTNSTGSIIYDYDSIPSVEGTAGSGFDFGYWIVDGLSVNTSNPIPILMDSNHTIAVIFIVEPPPSGTSGPPPNVNLGSFDILVVVRDLYYDPLQGAAVTLIDDGVEALSGETDEFGKFQIDNRISFHTYTVIVVYAGRSQSQEVILNSDVTLYYEFDKSPDYLALLVLLFNNIITAIGNFIRTLGRSIGLTLMPSYVGDPVNIGYVVLALVALPTGYFMCKRVKRRVHRRKRRKKR